jgi:biotin operon repressor
VAYLAKKHNVSQQKVIDAVKKAGVSRTAVEKELKKGK